MCLRQVLKGLPCVGGSVLPGGSGSEWIVEWMMSKPFWVRLHILFTHPHTHICTHIQIPACASSLAPHAQGRHTEKVTENQQRSMPSPIWTSKRRAVSSPPPLCWVPVWDLSSHVHLLALYGRLNDGRPPPAVVWSAGRDRLPHRSERDRESEDVSLRLHKSFHLGYF